MAYATTNFASKKALKEAVASGQKIGVYSPGPFDVPRNGTVTLEGPWYPKPHKWYGTATVKDGVIVNVK
jgi:hypothetical protein